MDFLNRIENQLDMPSGDKAEVMRELTAHFDELYDEFVASGMGPAKAETAAAERMGSPLNIAARLNAAHSTASWKSALLAAAPFGVSALYRSASALHVPSAVGSAVLVPVGIVVLVANARLLLCERRPAWLPTWLVAGLMCATADGSVPVVAGARAAALSPLILSALILGLVPAIALMVAFARWLFEAHRYGSAAHTSLFLFAMLMLRFGGSPRASDAWGQVIVAGVCGLAVVWFSRVPTRRGKMAAIYAGLFACGLVVPLPLMFVPSPHLPLRLVSAMLSAALWALIYQFIIAWPLRREEAERNRLTIAR